jgi:prepilin-type N-terminal cleavage/methylation domain-containing protein
MERTPSVGGGRDAGARERGFSLVEVLVATTLVATGLVGVAQVFTTVTASNLAAERATYATILAAQKVEELRAAPFDSTTSGADAVGGFARAWTIAPLADNPEQAAVIRVVVVRTAARGTDAVRLLTVRTRRAP